MGLFDRLMGRTSEVREIEMDGQRLRVDASGRPVFDEAQKIAFGTAKQFRSAITPDDVGSPYGYGLGLERDETLLWARCGDDRGVLAEVATRVPMAAVNLINHGRFTTVDMLAAMGITPAGESLTGVFAAGSDNDDFSRQMAAVIREGFGYGGSGGPTIDRLGADPAFEVTVTAWHLQALARLDAAGRTQIPDL